MCKSEQLETLTKQELKCLRARSCDSIRDLEEQLQFLKERINNIDIELDKE